MAELGQLTVNSAAATYTRDGQELIITPAAGLHRDGVHRGSPVRRSSEVITDPDGSIEGWVPTDDGAFVVGEPQGSPGWYPANDNPRDKATYDFTVTVPAGLTVMANGVLESQTTVGFTTTFAWNNTSPMAPYLATATVGVRPDRNDAAGGLPSYVAVDPDVLPKGNVLRKLPEIVEFYSLIYGPYPFEAVGAIVDDAQEVGYSLETQTKPVFYKVPIDYRWRTRSRTWYGDSVTLTEWPDIWLHQGFATWSEWI